jgi:hypothetical protein
MLHLVSWLAAPGISTAMEVKLYLAAVASAKTSNYVFMHVLSCILCTLNCSLTKLCLHACAKLYFVHIKLFTHAFAKSCLYTVNYGFIHLLSWIHTIAKLYTHWPLLLSCIPYTRVTTTFRGWSNYSMHEKQLSEVMVARKKYHQVQVREQFVATHMP